jgi:hypothetical protein
MPITVPIKVSCTICGNELDARIVTHSKSNTPANGIIKLQVSPCKCVERKRTKDLQTGTLPTFSEDVTRYTPIEGTIEPSPDGDYILYKDAVKLSKLAYYAASDDTYKALRTILDKHGIPL